MENDLISVIVPVYNVVPYLEKCVKSIIAQSYSNLDIILIDDGSTDGSGYVCDRFAEVDKRIRVIHKGNGGVSAARNVGIESAKGRYFAFVDSDDSVRPDMIEILYCHLINENADLSICGYERVDEKGGKIKQDSIPQGIGFITGKDILNKRFFTNEIIYWCVLWNKLFSRDLFDGIRFPDGIGSEDVFVLSHILKNNIRVASFDEKLYYYTSRTGSLITNTRRQKLDQMTVFFRLAQLFAPEKEYSLFTEKLLLSGIALFKTMFGERLMRNDVDKALFNKRRKEAIKRYGAAWKQYRSIIFTDLRKYVYFGKHYLWFILVRFFKI